MDHLLINAESFEITHLPQLPGWQTMRVGGDLAGVANAHLQMMPVDGGDPAEVRLLPSESHYLAAVLDPQATVTPTTQPEAAGTPTTRIATDPAPTVEAGESLEVLEAEQVEARVFPWFPVAAADIIVGLALFGVWRRRSQPRR